MAAAAPEWNVSRSITLGTAYGLSAAEMPFRRSREAFPRGTRDTRHGAMASRKRGGGSLSGGAAGPRCRSGGLAAALEAAVSELFQRPPWFWIYFVETAALPLLREPFQRQNYSFKDFAIRAASKEILARPPSLLKLSLHSCQSHKLCLSSQGS